MVSTNTELEPGSFTKVWTVRSSARGSLRRWAVARRNFLEGPDGGYRGRRVLSTHPDHSKSSPTAFSRAFSSRTKTNGTFNVSSASIEGSGGALGAEHGTFDLLTLDDLAWESDIKVDDPGLLGIELDKSKGTVVSDVEPAFEEHDRWAPITTVKDAERVFNRTKAPGGSYNREAANYQQQ